MSSVSADLDGTPASSKTATPLVMTHRRPTVARWSPSSEDDKSIRRSRRSDSVRFDNTLAKSRNAPQKRARKETFDARYVNTSELTDEAMNWVGADAHVSPYSPNTKVSAARPRVLPQAAPGRLSERRSATGGRPPRMRDERLPLHVTFIYCWNADRLRGRRQKRSRPAQGGDVAVCNSTHVR